jgi:hypothetical protein
MSQLHMEDGKMLVVELSREQLSSVVGGECASPGKLELLFDTHAVDAFNHPPPAGGAEGASFNPAMFGD